MNLTEMALKTKTMQEPPRPGAEMWKKSRFESFYTIPSPKAKGSKGERLAADVMEGLNHTILRNKKGKPIRRKGDPGHDIVVEGYLTEVKTSLTWGEELNSFTWQQIRTMQHYDRIIFIGINPDSVQMWWATKGDIDKFIAGNDAYRQHGGKKGKQDLYWIQKEVPSWFKPMEEWK